MNAISFKKWVSTILLLAITISLCGCSTNRTAASQDEHLTTTTAFIVLNGANVPALNSSAIASFVDTPQDGDRSILIVPDGNPSITTFSFDSTAKNVTYATAESKKWYKEICTSIIDARPDDADTDLLSAILLAANIEFIKNRIPNGQNFILKFVPLFLCIIYGRCQKDANNLMRVHFSHYMNPPSMGNYESFRLSEFVSSKAHVSISTASSIILSLHTIISKAQAPLLSVACSKSYSICTR